jgi:hypothetical protein
MAGIVGSKSARASGGISTTTVGPYTVHAFTTTGANTFTPATTGFVDILLVGGGGSSGGWPNPFAGQGGGGAGATLFKKMIPVVAGTPYPIIVGSGGPNVGSRGSTGGITTAFGNSAYGGGGGGGFLGPGSGPYFGENSPLASGGGSISVPSGGTGANIYGIGFPGGNSNNPTGAGGGGAGGAGQNSPTGSPPQPGAGGPGVPIVYFTGNPADINISKGGAGHPTPATPTAGGGGYGSGGFVDGATPSPINGRQGVAYIRYI